MEIILIGAAALLIFGPRRLPELAKGLGKGIRDFKKALDGSDEEHDSSTKSSTSASAASHDALPPAGTIAKQSTADPVKAKVPGSDDSRS